MSRKLLPIIFLIVLTACADPPLTAQAMYPREQAYDQLPEDYYLKGKVTVGAMTNAMDRPVQRMLFDNFPFALKTAFARAGMLEVDASKAEYRLIGVIRDFAFPQCMFGSCETGTSVEYTLSDTREGSPVYRELVVVPYTLEYPIFGANMVQVYFATAGGAMGENIAHLVRSLAEKTKNDLKPI